MSDQVPSTAPAVSMLEQPGEPSREIELRLKAETDARIADRAAKSPRATVLLLEAKVDALLVTRASLIADRAARTAAFRGPAAEEWTRLREEKDKAEKEESTTTSLVQIIDHDMYCLKTNLTTFCMDQDRSQPGLSSDSKRERLDYFDDVVANLKKMRKTLANPPSEAEEEEEAVVNEHAIVQIMYKGDNFPSQANVCKAFDRKMFATPLTRGEYVNVEALWKETIYDQDRGLVDCCFMEVKDPAHVAKIVKLKNFIIEYPCKGGVGASYVTFKLPTFPSKIRTQWRKVGEKLEELKYLDKELLANHAIPAMYDDCLLSYVVPSTFVDDTDIVPQLETIKNMLNLGRFADLTHLVKKPVNMKDLLETVDELNKSRHLVLVELRQFQAKGFDFVIPGFN